MELKFERASRCFVCLLCMIGVVLATVIGLMIGLACKSGCDCQRGALCVSRPAFGSELGKNVVKVDLAPNSAITKIVVTIIPENATPVDAGVIQVFNPNAILETYFRMVPAEQFATYELNFAHPLCVGQEGASVFLIPLNNLEQTQARELVLNVFYCTEECVVNNGDG